jgi:hypothetical protein
LVGCCVKLSIGGRLKAWQILLYLFFCAEFRWLKRLHGVFPYRHRPARRLSQVFSNDRATFRLVVASSHPAGGIKIRGPIALSIFISFSLYSPPKTTSWRPPLCVPPVWIFSPMPPPSPTLLFGWLLRLPVKWRPSKAGAPPVSQFFDGRHFDAPNKGKTRSAREPGRLAPLLGS